MIDNTSQAVANNIKHIAFIMDGNGRWAKKHGLPREAGHKYGASVFKKIVEKCLKLRIRATTFYVFSTENWKRPEKEVNALMNLLSDYIDDCISEIKKDPQKSIKYVFLGDKAPFPKEMAERMTEIEKLTENNEYIINLALNYGGRDEIVYAVKTLIKNGVKEITEDSISQCIYTKDSPELDLIVRTGGDLRLSNFLMWQSAYAELYFVDKLWPDFTPEDVDIAIETFNNRKRRFGGV